MFRNQFPPWRASADEAERYQLESQEIIFARHDHEEWQRPPCAAESLSRGDRESSSTVAELYRLNGDYNPLHADPAVAREAGFARPILHGLCTLGIAGHALLRSCCDYDPGRMRSLTLRFSAPVFPGETLRTEMWRDGDVVSFRTRVVEREIVVLNNGRMEVAGSR
jgi:acyl dehydratase